ERAQGLRLREARVGAQRPVVRGDRRAQRQQGSLWLAAREQDAALLQGQLALDAGGAALEEVLDLGPETLGDDAQDPDRWPRLAHLDLVKERSAHVAADDLREAQALVRSAASDALPGGRFAFRAGRG